MKYLVRFATGHPILAIAFCVMVTLGFSLGIFNLYFEGDLRALLPQEWGSKLEAERVERIFGASEIVIYVLEDDEPLSAESLQALEQIEDLIAEADISSTVTSLASVKEILGEGDELIVRDFLQELPQNERERQALEQRIVDDPLMHGSLYAEDGSGLSIIAMLNPKMAESRLIQALESVREKYSGPGDLYFAGLPALRAYMGIYMRADLGMFLPLGFSFMIILLFISFRNFRGVFLPLIVVAMSIGTSMGLMGLLGKPLTVIGILLPVMLIAIANDYGIHLVARYIEDAPVATGSDRQARAQIASKGLEHVALPIILAAVTTIIGFLSLVSHAMPPAKDLGMLSAFGVFTAILYSCLFIPAWLTVLPIPKGLLNKQRKPNRLLVGMTRFCVQNPIPVVSIFVGMLLAFAIGILHVEVDANPLSYFDQEGEIVTTADTVNDHYGGGTSMSIMFTGDMLEPANVNKLDTVVKIMNTWPEVGIAESIADYLRRIHGAINPELGPSLPENRYQIYEEMDLYSFQGGESDRLLDIDFSHAQILARLLVRTAGDFKRVVLLSNRLIDILYGDEFRSGRLLFATRKAAMYTRISSEEPGILRSLRLQSLGKLDYRVSFKVTGFAVMLVDLTHMVVRGQVRSLIVSLLMVLLCASIFLRSFKAGLLALGPLVLAVVMVLGIMGYMGIELNMITAMLTSIVIGVGVDYTVHYLWRYRDERMLGADPEQAAVTTATTTGLGIVTNALSVVVGFIVLLSSNFVPVRFFGWLIVLSILTCLLGAFCLLPALFGLGVGWPKTGQPDKKTL